MEIFNLTLIGETITFVILVWFTMKYIWPPVIKAINERQKKIVEGLEAAERGKLNLELAQQEAIKIIQQAKKEASGIIEQANQQVVTIIENGKIKAKEEGERLLVLARADIENAKEAMKFELRKQMSALAILAAEKILRSNLNVEKNKNIIEDLF